MTTEKCKKGKLVYALIALLALVAILQISILIKCKKDKPVQEEKQLSAISTKPIAIPDAVLPATKTQSALKPVDPWDEFDASMQQMSSFMRHAFNFGSTVFKNFPNTGGFDFTPAIDLAETAGAYVITSDLPGLEKDKIELTVKDNVLTIQGVREVIHETSDEQTGFVSQERSSGSFYRSITLPGAVDETKIKATYQNGVLTITLPKATAAESVPQKVAIQ